MKKMLKSSVAAAVALVGFSSVAIPAFATTATTKVSCYPLYPTGKIKALKLSTCTVTASTTVVADATNSDANFGSNMGQNSSLDPDLSFPPVSLTTGGSSFIKPFVQALTSNSVFAPSNAVNWSTYQGSGSGDARTGITSGNYDFGFSDQPMSATAGTLKTGYAASDYVQVPESFGGVVVAYDLGAGLNNLKLTPAILESIFNGAITSWADSAIVNLNGGSTSMIGKALANLPSTTKTIKPLERLGGSGTTYAFLDYLKTAAGSLPSSVVTAVSGLSTVPTSGVSGNQLDQTGWHGNFGTAVSGNSGMANALVTASGAIGYLEYSYLLIPGNSAIDTAQLQDAHGDWLKPSLKNITASATAAGTVITPTDFTSVYLTATTATTAVWPITTFSWAMIAKDQSNSVNKGKAAVKFLDWMAHFGQTLAKVNGYVPLPLAIQNYDRKQLMNVKNGSAILLLQAS
jgi:phosphate transport system substrate-binding protein